MVDAAVFVLRSVTTFVTGCKKKDMVHVWRMVSYEQTSIDTMFDNLASLPAGYDDVVVA